MADYECEGAGVKDVTEPETWSMQLGKDLFKRQPIKRWEDKTQICLPEGGRVRDNIEKKEV